MFTQLRQLFGVRDASTASNNDPSSSRGVRWEARSTDPRAEGSRSLSSSTLPPLETSAILQKCSIIREEELPSVLSLRRIGAIAPTIPNRVSLDGNPEFCVSDIRANRTVKIRNDGGDEARVEITSFFKHQEVIDFFTRYFGGERRYAAGIQFHSMREGAVLKEHKHGPDDIFVIFHFDQDYEGGRYFERHDGELWHPPLTPFCACVNHSAVPHGVEKIQKGTRSVLVTSWEPSTYKT